jgi:hypothetical protein
MQRSEGVPEPRQSIQSDAIGRGPETHVPTQQEPAFLVALSAAAGDVDRNRMVGVLLAV